MGTPGYLAPEVLVGESATTATDVHGWASTLVYAATGRSPYGRGHVMTVLDRTHRGDFDLNGVPERLKPLLAAALASHPHERPTVSEAMTALDALESGPATAPWPARTTGRPVVRPAPGTRPYTVVAPQPRTAPGATAYPPPIPVRPERPAGWTRFRRNIVLLGLAVVVVAGFSAAPYVTAALLTLAVLLARGASHGRDATWSRRSLRGPKWFDGPLAVLSYPWHVVRGSVGSLGLLLTAVALTAAAVATLLLAGRSAPEALSVGGVVLALSTWVGPGSARLRDPVGRAATVAARHPVVWWLMIVGLVGCAAACWWTGNQEGVLWDPASGPPTDRLRDIADLGGLR
jgi:hypothetical protein